MRVITKSKLFRYVGGLIILVTASFLYYLAYCSSNTVAPTSSKARLDLSILWFQTPLTERVAQVWNAAFYPLRYLDALSQSETTIRGTLVDPVDSFSICIQEESGERHRLLSGATRHMDLKEVYGKRVVAICGARIEDKCLPPPYLPCYSEYVKSIRVSN